MKELYCLECKKITPHQPKLDALKDGKMVCNECDNMNSYCTLLKPNEPNFIKTSIGVKFITWGEHDEYQSHSDKPTLGASLIMSPFNDFYTWMTSIITEIIDEHNNYIKFKTTNSTYELYYIEQNNITINEL